MDREAMEKRQQANRALREALREKLEANRGSIPLERLMGRSEAREQEEPQEKDEE